MMTEAQCIEYVKSAIEQYQTLRKPVCDLVGWVALKLSCTRERAVELIAKADADTAALWGK